MPAEKEHLVKIELLLKMHKRGMTISDISGELNLNRNSVAKYLDILVSSGRAERTGFGNTGVFFLSHRVPVSSLLNFSSEFVILLDYKGRIIQVNECLLSCFGVTRESLEGKTLDEAPVEMIRAFKDMDIFTRTGVVRECTSEVSTLLSGEAYHFRVKVVPTLFEDGKHGFTILIENVTTQKRYEQELIRSEARYRAIVEDQTDLICRRLPNGTITFANDAFCRYFGKKHDDLIGTSFSPVTASPGSGDKPGDPRRDQAGTTEDRVILANGAIKWIQWKNRALHSETGGIVEIQSVGRDITGQREREKEILLRDCAISRSSHPIALFDMIGRAVYLNSAFLSFFGYPDDHELIGHPVEKCFPRSDADHNIHQIAAALREHGHYEATFEARKRDGTRFEVEFYGRLIGDDRYFPHGGIVLFAEHRRGAPADEGKTVSIAVGRLPVVNKMRDEGAKDMTGPKGEGTWKQAGPTGETGGDRIGPSQGGTVDRQEQPAGIPGKPSPGSDAGDPGHGSGQQTSPVSVGDSPGIPPLSFDELVDFILDPTFIVDREKNIIAWNRAMEIFTGIPKEEVMGGSGHGNAFSIYPEKRPILIDLLDLPEDVLCQEHPDVRRYGDTLFRERFIPGFRGTPGAYIYAKAAYLLDREGRCLASMETVTDITDWRTAQESLERMRDEIDTRFTGLIRQLEEKIGSLDEMPER